MNDVIFKLQNSSKILFRVLCSTKRKLTQTDFTFFICIINDTANVTVVNQIINSSTCKKLLGVKLDNKFTFNAHIDEICKRAALKLNALSRIASYMDFNKKTVISECTLYVSVQLLSFCLVKSHKK